MFYACLAAFLCLFLGILGLVMAFVDIKNYNFGLYLALLSVVGTTVSIAFWIIGPAACSNNPKWVQALLRRYGYKLDPLREFFRVYIGQSEPIAKLQNYPIGFREDEESGRVLPQRLSPRRTRSAPEESVNQTTVFE